MSNVNSIKTKEVNLSIDDVSYVIKYTLNSFAILEEKYGDIETAMNCLMGNPVLDENGKPVKEKDPDTGKMVDKRKVNISDIITFMWAGFRAKQPLLTREDVGDLVTLDNLGDIMPKLTEAFTSSLPQENEVAEKN